MVTGRRRLMQALTALPIIAAAGAATAATTDIVLNCDTTLGLAMNAVAARFFTLARVRVRVFPTDPGDRLNPGGAMRGALSRRMRRAG
jgi:hypothetical protein